ncbi:lipid kinase, YegS/Rv2252/BmrU family [Microbulbifer yueqingensis]|uniref:Lipid kinase, YegS/Rv2252/BmrU family n=1 Tax=Microbulbifer yueqingensis TaxID=658219 RepID=A0A1G9ACK8_9GAMM|nr:lipid kinase, YegS/Rv2252/BmrU family [Microbulbifer yueqingensis]
MLNPKSRAAAVADLAAGLEQLREAGIEVERVESGSVEEMHEAIRSRCDEFDLVIIGGGDGTISAAAGVLLECGQPLAVLPLGTANDLARSLGIGSDLERAFAVIADNHRTRIDLGEVNGHYFFNVANIGLGVHVTRELTDEVKKRWGVFSYFKAMGAALARSDQFRVRLKIDGHEHSLRSIQLAVGNGRFYGGGNVVDQDATINDGLLDLYSVRPQRLWELVTLAPLLRGGRHDLVRRVFNAAGREIEIDTNPEHMEVHADGEPVTQTPATFKVREKVLEVVVPRDAPELTARGNAGLSGERRTGGRPNSDMENGEAWH